MRPGETATLDIVSINSEGEGIARHGDEGFVIFVPEALPGERVICRITKTSKKYAAAKVLSIENPSVGRAAPQCPIFGKCGGCQLQHASYATQLEIKATILGDALRRIGGIEQRGQIQCVPSPKEWGYRNKTTMPAQSTGRSAGNSLVCGYYERRSHRIVPFSTCAILEPALEHLLLETIGLFPTLGFKGYNESTKKGDIRHLVARCNSAEPEVESLLGCVTAKAPGPREYGKLKNLQQLLAKGNPGLRGSILNIKTGEDNFIWGPVFKPLSGKRFIRQQLGDYRFDVDISAFFQINTAQTERLFAYVRDLTAPFSAKRILELYSGVGGLTAYIAGLCESLDAVEEWRPAAKLFASNAALNGLGNVSLHTDAAEKFMQNTAGHYDLVVLDPPRTGCGESVTAGIRRVAPEGIIYVSCNPATLARDIARLSSDGLYTLDSVAAFDMFPQTAHVEAVAVLRKK